MNTPTPDDLRAGKNIPMGYAEMCDWLDAASDEWQAREEDYRAIHSEVCALRNSDLNIRRQLKDQQARIEELEMRLVETMLAWRAGERPEDYPDLATLAGSET